jgi:hypothetical protein
VALVGKLLSLVVAVFYLVVAHRAGAGAGMCVVILAYLLLPLACIWFGDELNIFPEHIGKLYAESESPGCVVRLIGWILLALPVIVALIAKGLGGGH